MRKKKIGVLVGSPRKASFSRKVARTMMEIASESLEGEFIEIAHLPLYNQDLEDAGESPSSWIEFRKQLKDCDGFLFVTPEYNRGLPALLKNALDVGSRPYGQGAWSGKPGAVISISQGAMGGFGANHSLRQSLVFLNVPCMQQPEAYLGGVAAMFDQDGNMTAASTRDFLKKFAEAFRDWVAVHGRDGAAH